MRLTEQDAILQRETILDTAFEVFSTVGFAATKMEMISKKANISRSPLYYYFSNKQELFKAVCIRYFRFYLNKIDAMAEDETLTIYERYYQLFLEARLPEYTMGNKLSDEILSGGPELEELKELHKEYWNGLRERDMEALKKARARGEIRDDADLDAMLNLYYTIYLGLRAPKLQEEYTDHDKLQQVCYTAVKMIESLYSPNEREKKSFRR